MDAIADADVVIVGAGLAGLTAANRARQQGKRVIVLEAGADERYLCNSRIASGSFNLAHSDPTAEPALLREAVQGSQSRIHRRRIDRRDRQRSRITPERQ